MSIKTHHRNRWAVRGLNLIQFLVVVVVNGVYGGVFRDYGFLILLIALTAYLRITYRPAEKNDVVVVEFATA